MLLSRTRYEGQDRQAKTLNFQETENKAHGTKGADVLPAWKLVKTRHVIIGILACVKITSLRQDEYMAKDASLDMLRRRRSPAKSQRRVVRKDQLPYWGSFCNWVVCLKILIRESLFYRWKIGIESRSQILQGPVALKKKYGRERVHPEGTFRGVSLIFEIQVHDWNYRRLISNTAHLLSDDSILTPSPQRRLSFLFDSW